METPASPLVSVCVSAYDTEAWVTQAVRSALDQTIADVEVVVVDNASTDGTAAALAAITDPRLRVIPVPENLGAAGGRRRALQEARGTWVAVLDSDDWYAPDRLEHLLGIADQHGADIVVDDLYLIDDGAEHPWSTLFTGQYDGTDGGVPVDAAAFVRSDRWLQPGLRMGLTKPLMRRRVLVEHDCYPDPDLTVVHDFWWALDALLTGARLWLTPRPGYYYRARPGQLVSSGRELVTLDEQIVQTTITLARPDVAADPVLSAELRTSLEYWEAARHYLRFLAALRAGRLRGAAAIARRHPAVLVELTRKAPNWLRRQVSHDDYAGHMTRRF